ncbi:MAG: hypothetical protein Q9162_007782, partial [Coniocarpon cinnabarinum]
DKLSQKLAEIRARRERMTAEVRRQKMEIAKLKSEEIRLEKEGREMVSREVRILNELDIAEATGVDTVNLEEGLDAVVYPDGGFMPDVLPWDDLALLDGDSLEASAGSRSNS